MSPHHVFCNARAPARSATSRNMRRHGQANRPSCFTRRRSCPAWWARGPGPPVVQQIDPDVLLAATAPPNASDAWKVSALFADRYGAVDTAIRGPDSDRCVRSSQQVVARGRRPARGIQRGPPKGRVLRGGSLYRPTAHLADRLSTLERQELGVRGDGLTTWSSRTDGSLVSASQTGIGATALAGSESANRTCARRRSPSRPPASSRPSRQWSGRSICGNGASDR